MAAKKLLQSKTLQRLDTVAMTPCDAAALRQAVYEIVQMVPRGKATTYGAIARAVGYPMHSRMVGRIMAACESAKNGIPAHRVVNSRGELSGKDAFGPSGEMQRLLESEGIKVENGRIANWRHVFWDPIREIA
jgi:methylated-DNA-protein-cysteine methyltransferase-like protein